MDLVPGFLGWSVLGVAALYVFIRFATGRMIIWDSADTPEQAWAFRKAILSYVPSWIGYGLWLAAGIATFVFTHLDGMLSQLPIIYVIAIQMWSLQTPRDYRSAASKVLCSTLPFTLAFFVFVYPKDNIHTFVALLTWICLSMILQLITLKAIKEQAIVEILSQQEVFLKQNVFGTAGNALTTSDFSDKNIELGIKGEKKTANVLNALASECSDLYIFHSVKWVNNPTYDIDHIAYYKGNVVFLDSKFWGNGVHEIDENSFVYKDGVNRNMQIHLNTALQDYNNAVSFNRADVWIVVQGNNDAGIKIGKCNDNGELALIAGSNLDANMRTWMKLIDDKGWDVGADYGTLATFRNNLQ